MFPWCTGKSTDDVKCILRNSLLTPSSAGLGPALGRTGSWWARIEGSSPSAQILVMSQWESEINLRPTLLFVDQENRQLFTKIYYRNILGNSTIRKLVQQTGVFVSEDQKEGLDLNYKHWNHWVKPVHDT